MGALRVLWHSSHRCAMLAQVYAAQLREARQGDQPDPPLSVGFSHELCAGIIDKNKPLQQIAQEEVCLLLPAWQQSVVHGACTLVPAFYRMAAAACRLHLQCAIWHLAMFVEHATHPFHSNTVCLRRCWRRLGITRQRILSSLL